MPKVKFIERKHLLPLDTKEKIAKIKQFGDLTRISENCGSSVIEIKRAIENGYGRLNTIKAIVQYYDSITIENYYA